MKYALTIVVVLAVVLIGWKLLSNGGQNTMFAPSGEPTSTVPVEEQQAAMQTFEKDSLPPQAGQPRN